MLDQNTDRMWYVIGAVIVGAALILITNGAFPNLFAAVGETFNEKVEQTTEVTDGIMPAVPTYASRELRIISTGYGSINPISGNPNGDSAIYDVSSFKNAEDDSVLLDYSLKREEEPDVDMTFAYVRGLTMYVFDAANELVFQDYYDVHDTVQVDGLSNSGHLAKAINSFTDPTNTIVIVLGDAATGGNDPLNGGKAGTQQLADGLGNAMYSIGASPSIYGQLDYREPYVLVGHPNSGQGSGYEATADRYTVVDVNIKISKGTVTVLDQKEVK